MWALDRDDNAVEFRKRSNINWCYRKSYRTAKKKQKYYYSGKKKKHTLKTQLIVGKTNKKIICTNFSNGKRHDFRVFKESKVDIHPEITTITDTGYQGIQKIHSKSKIPRKRTKKQRLTKEDKLNNRALASRSLSKLHSIVIPAKLLG